MKDLETVLRAERIACIRFAKGFDRDVRKWAYKMYKSKLRWEMVNSRLRGVGRAFALLSGVNE